MVSELLDTPLEIDDAASDSSDYEDVSSDYVDVPEDAPMLTDAPSPRDDCRVNLIDQMQQQQWRGTEIPVWEMNAPDEESLRLVLEWIYFGDIDFTLFNVWGVLSLSQQMGLTALLARVYGYLTVALAFPVAMTADTGITTTDAACSVSMDHVSRDEGEWAIALVGAVRCAVDENVIKRIIHLASESSRAHTEPPAPAILTGDSDSSLVLNEYSQCQLSFTLPRAAPSSSPSPSLSSTTSTLLHPPPATEAFLSYRFIRRVMDHRASSLLNDPLSPSQIKALLALVQFDQFTVRELEVLQEDDGVPRETMAYALMSSVRRRERSEEELRTGMKVAVEVARKAVVVGEKGLMRGVSAVAAAACNGVNDDVNGIGVGGAAGGDTTLSKAATEPSSSSLSSHSSKPRPASILKGPRSLSKKGSTVSFSLRGLSSSGGRGGVDEDGGPDTLRGSKSSNTSSLLSSATAASEKVGALDNSMDTSSHHAKPKFAALPKKVRPALTSDLFTSLPLVESSIVSTESSNPLPSWESLSQEQQQQDKSTDQLPEQTFSPPPSHSHQLVSPVSDVISEEAVINVGQEDADGLDESEFPVTITTYVSVSAISPLPKSEISAVFPPAAAAFDTEFSVETGEKNAENDAGGTANSFPEKCFVPCDESSSSSSDYADRSCVSIASSTYSEVLRRSRLSNDCLTGKEDSDGGDGDHRETSLLQEAGPSFFSEVSFFADSDPSFSSVSLESREQDSIEKDAKSTTTAPVATAEFSIGDIGEMSSILNEMPDVSGAVLSGIDMSLDFTLDDLVDDSQAPVPSLFDKELDSGNATVIHQKDEIDVLLRNIGVSDAQQPLASSNMANVDTTSSENVEGQRLLGHALGSASSVVKTTSMTDVAPDPITATTTTTIIMQKDFGPAPPELGHYIQRQRTPDLLEEAARKLQKIADEQQMFESRSDDGVANKASIELLVPPRPPVRVSSRRQSLLQATRAAPSESAIDVLSVLGAIRSSAEKSYSDVKHMRIKGEGREMSKVKVRGRRSVPEDPSSSNESLLSSSASISLATSNTSIVKDSSFLDSSLIIGSQWQNHNHQHHLHHHHFTSQSYPFAESGLSLQPGGNDSSLRSAQGSRDRKPNAIWGSTSAAATAAAEAAAATSETSSVLADENSDSAIDKVVHQKLQRQRHPQQKQHQHQQKQPQSNSKGFGWGGKRSRSRSFSVASSGEEEAINKSYQRRGELCVGSEISAADSSFLSAGDLSLVGDLSLENSVSSITPSRTHAVSSKSSVLKEFITFLKK